jgi:rhodanese-related sulfurtransferase
METRDLAFRLLLAAGLAALPATGSAVTAQELRGLLDRREPVLIIDVRGGREFSEAHIPGALNIPREILPHKQLPPLGRVVVCGDGRRAGETEEAVAVLNARRGIRAEALEGGLAVWESHGFPSTRAAGAVAERLRYVTYQELRGADGAADLLLVDLRVGGEGTDLAARFPALAQARVEAASGEEAVAATVARLGGDGRKLLVLIDDADGRSEALARRLKGAGVQRVAILAGGEEALRREGRSGLKTQELRSAP